MECRIHAVPVHGANPHPLRPRLRCQHRYPVGVSVARSSMRRDHAETEADCGAMRYWVSLNLDAVYRWSPAIRIEFTDRSIAINPISIKPAWMTLPVRARSNWTHRLPGRMCESTIAVRSLMDEYRIESVRIRINRLLTNGHTSTPHPMIRNPMFRVLR